VLIVILTVIARGNAAEVPIALLAAANVGYFVSMTLALWAAWLNHRHPVRPGLLRLRPALARLAPVLAVVNLLLLLAAGTAWGWINMAIGVAVLAATLAAASWTGRRRVRPAADDALLCFGSTHTPVRLMSADPARKVARI
jgi:hypothetical protein